MLPEIVSRLVCSGCGYEPSQDDPLPFRCPRLGEDGRDHVLRRRLSVDDWRAPRWSEIFARTETHPFIRYRELLHSYRTAVLSGRGDDEFVFEVRALDRAVASVDGKGFRETPLLDVSDLAAELGVGRMLLKDETGNVAGSHKGRHLFGAMLWLRLQGTAADAPLAIASCGNAALAAAVIARAANLELDVFVPPRADPTILERLCSLGSRIVTCERREGELGDPCYLRFFEALSRSHRPFSCQGNVNALTLDGGRTLPWEVVSQLRRMDRSLDRVFVQVGGGALASSFIQGLFEAHRLGQVERLPVIHAVQAEAAHPLERAWHRLDVEGATAEGIDGLLRRAAEARGDFMWPWEEEPVGVADGILDDETYDWHAIVDGMARTGGSPVVVSEDELLEARELAARTTAIEASCTGTSGLAGALHLARRGELGPGESIGVVLTGVAR